MRQEVVRGKLKMAVAQTIIKIPSITIEDAQPCGPGLKQPCTDNRNVAHGYSRPTSQLKIHQSLLPGFCHVKHGCPTWQLHGNCGDDLVGPFKSRSRGAPVEQYIPV